MNGTISNNSDERGLLPYCKPIIKHCNRKQPLQEKKQGKKHRRKRKRKATKWSYNSNIFL